MSDFTNSRRTLLKATYVPLTIQPPAGSNIGGAAADQPPVLQKIAFVRALQLKPDELRTLGAEPALKAMRTTTRRAARGRPGIRAKKVCDVISDVAKATSQAAISASAAHLRQMTTAQLGSVARSVQVLRADRASSVARAIEDVFAVHAAVGAPAIGVTPTASAILSAANRSAPAIDVLRKAVRSGPDRSLLTKPRNARRDLTTLVDYYRGASSSTDALIDDFLLQFRFQPVGRLHLERMEMKPVGIENGELVYSVPLTPGETVNITHREWTETTSTFESLVSEALEGFSEKGVTDKTDMTTAVSNETKHSSAFDVNGQVSFSYSGSPYSVSTSAGVDYKTSAEDQRAVKDSQAHSLAITSLASARTRKEHKQSFRVTSIASSEDLAVRVLTNKSPNQTMRADYFRLMRRWQVDLIRYGLRMTYDFVVPNPGATLGTKAVELRTVQAILASDDVFSLSVSDITESNYQHLAATYEALLKPPPQPPGDMQQSTLLTKTGDDFAYGSTAFSIPDDYEIAYARIWARYSYAGDGTRGLSFNVRDGAYKPEVKSRGGGNVDDAVYDSDDAALDPNRIFEHSLAGRSGQVTVDYVWYHVDAGEVTVRLKLVPKAATIEAWQLDCWKALREAATNVHATSVRQAAIREKQLLDEIASFDSLTLRRMEREEIMRLVLVWVFGPSFQLVPPLYEVLANLSADGSGDIDGPFPDPVALSPASWDAVRRYGEFIKFLNNAIEWENVLFFCYPYFWDVVANWPFKRFLMHPDPDHRVFLRAGCARVVLTIRPGFESDFAALVDYFTLPGHHHPSDSAGASSPYVTIGEEVRNYAMTNYGHIPPANPDNNARPLLFPLQIRAWNEMQDIMTVLEAYNEMKRSALNVTGDAFYYPPTLQDPQLLALLPLVVNAGKTISTLSAADPWGRTYVYSSPGTYGNRYDLVSYGRSGNSQESGEGLDAWITSYSEGNIVARWYEYTPTSALNVSVTMGAPNPTAF